ncbi:MAG: peptidoglycan DD-metalloendopeptidase family protein [Lachnospiraceae bacterium]|nr:peptidoglycan DD-metalloendopeptidase family protein [Lachnospiraceae bacterium]
MDKQNIKQAIREAVHKVDGRRIVAAAVVAALLLVWIPVDSVRVHSRELSAHIESLELQIEELTSENRELKIENEELASKVELMSQALSLQAQSEEVRQEEEARLSEPTEFPVTGAVSMIEVTKKDIEEKKKETASAQDIAQVEPLASDTPIMIFTATAGNTVIASGTGVVESIEEDEIYGKMIVIDHGNGYQSVYRNAGASKVEAGANVTRGTVLFVINSNNTVIGFQIKQDGEYVDPMDVVDIAG